MAALSTKRPVVHYRLIVQDMHNSVLTIEYDSPTAADRSYTHYARDNEVKLQVLMKNGAYRTLRSNVLARNRNSISSSQDFPDF